MVRKNLHSVTATELRVLAPGTKLRLYGSPPEKAFVGGGAIETGVVVGEIDMARAPWAAALPSSGSGEFVFIALRSGWLRKRDLVFGVMLELGYGWLAQLNSSKPMPDILMRVEEFEAL
jgi:hypothetical protein